MNPKGAPADRPVRLPAILEASEGRGAEVVVEAAGNPGALGLALAVAAKGGRVALVSIYHERTDIDLQLIADGRVRTEPLITHRLPLARIMEGIALMQSRQAIKVLLEP